MKTVIRNSYTPQIGDYCETIVVDRESGFKYLFDCDGVYTRSSIGEIIEDLDGYREAHKDTDVFSTGGTLDAIDYYVGEEAAAREAADEGLEQEIEDLRNNPDVVDIVGTYADLQSYDTSDLGDNDIIKVLQDETHDGASTYYKWHKTTSTWEYIGEQGPYYTKDQTDTLLDEKQDVLTAGDNITIDADNVISAEAGATHVYLKYVSPRYETYKDSNFTQAFSALEIYTATQESTVIFHMVSGTYTYEHVVGTANKQTLSGTTPQQYRINFDLIGYAGSTLTPSMTKLSSYPYNSDGTGNSFTMTVQELQEELTAGSGITISGNTISAAAFTTFYADISNLGAASLVLHSDDYLSSTVSAADLYGVYAAGGAAIIAFIPDPSDPSSPDEIRCYGAVVSAKGPGDYPGHNPDYEMVVDIITSSTGMKRCLYTASGLGSTWSRSKTTPVFYSAGTNVTINSSGVISATDTTYSAFTGATSSTAGTSGLAPAPAAGDQNKFLKGDGTWATAAPTTDATLSFSSTNPIQNQAITNTIFAEGTGQDAGKKAGVNIELNSTDIPAQGYPYVYIGSQNTLSRATGAVGVGFRNEAAATQSVAIGPWATVSGSSESAIAIGDTAEVDDWGERSVAIGNNAYVEDNCTDSVALGSNSEAHGSDIISVGNEDEGYYRPIKNVQEGYDDHDAVTVGQLNTATAVMTGATTSTNGKKGLVPAPTQYDTMKILKGDGTWGEPMVILSYGFSTWQDFIRAYSENEVVYCRASSNADPSVGAQGRMAFMAYVNNATSPTEVEFQYVRSVSSKTSSQPVDQVFVYKLTSANGGTWTVATRDMAPKLAAGTNTSVSYSSGTYTVSATDTTYSNMTGATSGAAGAAGLVPAPAAGDQGKFLQGDGTWATVQSGPTVVQTTGQSTTDVMSQKAVTDIIGNVETILQTLNSGNGAQ